MNALARDALAEASIPCSLPVLYQLTGDERWLGDRYRVQRIRGFENLSSGGLEPEIQAEVRDALAAAIEAFKAGKPPASPSPSAEEMTRLMTTATGEDIPVELAGLVGELIGLAPFEPDEVGDLLDRRDRDFSVIVIGAGVSGLLAGIALRRAGIPFTILEKNGEVGGTWLENRFPGSKVDIPSDLYSVSFAQRNWSERFAGRDELADYMVELADRFELRDSIQFGVEVTAARWNEDDQTWTVSTIDESNSSAELTGNAVITAVGLHNRPFVPEFPGAERFRGEIQHSARWPEHDDLIDGKRVAVIGSGATAMQVVCAVAPRAEQLSVIQRTPQWISPNPTFFEKTSETTHWLFDNVPYYRAWHRFRLYWVYCERLYGMQRLDPDWEDLPESVNRLNAAFRAALVQYMQAVLGDDQDLIEMCTPDYPVLGKRLLQDNGWFTTLLRPNVDLYKAGIAELTENGLVTTTGEEIEVDTIILCTGFTQQRVLSPMEITGSDGKTLADHWGDDDARAYLGMTTPGFPNLFFLYGPNANPPGGSYITVGEAQVRYIIQLLTQMVADDIGALDCRREPFERYNEELDEGNRQMAFGQPGLSSYYRNSRGRVVTNFPWTVPQYWNMTSKPDLADFEAVPLRASTSSS